MTQTSDITLQRIKHYVGDKYSVPPTEWTAPPEKVQLPLARQVALFLTGELTELSTIEIATTFKSNQDAVIKAQKKIKALSTVDPYFRDDLLHLLADIKEGTGERQ